MGPETTMDKMADGMYGREKAGRQLLGSTRVD